MEVYFDDFTVEHVKSAVVQSQDYYPFGLTFGAYQRENSIGNQYQYNSKELQDELNLGLLDYGARMYMPDIGRWGAIDPHAPRYISISPYNYAFNAPILIIDPNGKDGVLYIQVLMGKNGKPSIDANTVALAAKALKALYKNMGVDLDVKTSYSSKVMSKKDFYSREGAHKSDSYLLLGSNEQLVKGYKDAVKGGWEEMNSHDVSSPNLSFAGVNGESAKYDRISYLNSENIKNTHGVTVNRTMEQYRSVEEKLSTTVQHESGHPKFKSHPNRIGTHVPGTIMDENVYNTNFLHDEYMISRLKTLHGTVKDEKK